MRLALVLLLFLFVLAHCKAPRYKTHTYDVNALNGVREMLYDPMDKLKSWNRGDPCNDNWIGVVCYDTIHDDGYLHLRKLQLMNMDLSGNLSPRLGNLSRLNILNFMWNKIGGSIPKEIGNLKYLQQLLLTGNQLSGPLPDELGNLQNLTRMQINLNRISGSLPQSFLNLTELVHLHLNNNSIIGEIPRRLFTLPKLMHFVLDNNDLTGSLPYQLFNTGLSVLQLDNNNHLGGEIPANYGNITKLIKLSLRNCSLQESIPDFSRISSLSYIDLSLNQLKGSIPSQKLSDSMTTIILSHNNLDGNIPRSFSKLPRLQKLSLDNNKLSGNVPDALWKTRKFNQGNLTMDFRNNTLTKIDGSSSVPPNVTLMLEGNSICSNQNIVEQYCTNHLYVQADTSIPTCYSQGFQAPYKFPPTSPTSYGPAKPLIAFFRLESPGFADFHPYRNRFEEFLTHNLSLDISQLKIRCIISQEGPRLGMILELFPTDTKKSLFNTSEVQRIWGMFSEWIIPNHVDFGPYELLYFELLDPYLLVSENSASSVTKGELVGIILGAIVVAVALSAVVSYIIVKRHLRRYIGTSRRHKGSSASIQVKGVREFNFKEMANATSNFCSSTQIGQGGYGKVYKGTLVDGTLVAIKRAKEGSFQGMKEFSTEIKLLSRLHHKHLVSLLGYCDDKGDQMLVYEFMSNGTLHDHLSGRSKQALSFATRLKIALGSARGILYLHTEANPPIFHRDVKATNILLDAKFTAKVADFGLSRLAPEPGVDGSVPAHVSTMVKGTPGYLDPEYFMTNMLTEKSDVYGLGVVFLELLTGMQPISQGKNIVREVSTAYQLGNLFSLVDELMGAYDHECVARFANLALMCCHEESKLRPTVTEVVRELEEIISVILEDETILAAKSSYNDSKKKESIASSASSSTHNPSMDPHLLESDSISRSFTCIVPR